MRPGFRQAMTWLHNWAGLLIGWLALAIAAAGTLSVFRRELDAWCHPELPRGPVDQVAAGTAALRWLGGHATGAPSWFLDLAGGRTPGTLAFWSTPRGFVQRVLSPITGAPDGIRDSLGGEFFYRFHFELQLPYPWGRLLAAATAEVLLVILVTGIVAHRRIFKDFFTLRTGRGQRSWLDAHVVLGVLPLPFHLMIAATGLVTLASLLMPWGIAAGYRGGAAAFARDFSPAVERVATGHPAPLASVAPMLRAAQARFAGAGIATLAVANPGDAAQTVTLTAGEGRAIGIAAHALVFDGTTGRVLAETIERRPAVRVYDVLYGLHMGHFAGLASRWLYFLSGLMFTAAIATGLLLWTAKPRRARGFGFALVERLNLGVVAGLPLAFAAFLFANRLLPVALPARAAIEVRVLFATWAAALVVALAPPVRGWPVLTALLAVTGLATIAADVAQGGLVPGDGIAFGVDGVLLATAVGAGAVAWRLRGRRA